MGWDVVGALLVMGGAALDKSALALAFFNVEPGAGARLAMASSIRPYLTLARPWGWWWPPSSPCCSCAMHAGSPIG